MIKKVIYHLRKKDFMYTLKNYLIHKKLLMINLLFRDSYYSVKYGKVAPKYAELIFVKPVMIDSFLDANDVNDNYSLNIDRSASGRVIQEESIFNEAKDIFEVEKIKFCFSHWVDGKSWEETGVYKYYEYHINQGTYIDGLKSIDEVKKRYSNLDKIFQEVKKTGKFKKRVELDDVFREEGGIFVHVGPEGKLYFGGGGIHRFSMAIILDICFPAQIGIVHESAIPKLEQLRRPCKNNL